MTERPWKIIIVPGEKMDIGSVTKRNVQRLNTMSFPYVSQPFSVKILWIQIVDARRETPDVFIGDHRHSFWEAHLVLWGSAGYKTGDSSVSIGAGEGLIIPAGTLHRHLSDGGGYLKCSLAFTFDSRALSDLPRGARLFGAGKDCTDLIGELIEASQAENTFAEGIARCRGFELVYRVLKALGAEAVTEEKNGGFDPRFEVAKRCVAAHPDFGLSCEDVARECGIGVKQLGRIFKKHTGTTLFDYIRSGLLKRSEELLADRTLSVKEIALILGFENERYFSTYFKRHYGMPPGQFRRLAGAPKTK